MYLRGAFLVLLAVSVSACGPAAAGGPPKPHIVIFLADDLGWADVGFHHGEIRTPHIDGLADAGVRLDQFYVQPVCSPTRAALMTGRYPLRLGLQVGVVRPWSDYGLPLEERTLPQALKEAGYRTAIVGKWHLGSCSRAYLPTSRGFDHQYGHWVGAIDYYKQTRFESRDWHRDDKPLREEGYTTQMIAREAVRLVEEHDPSRPFFLYVPFNAPHAPLQAPQEYIDRYAHIQDGNRRTFAAMVACMDDAIGSVLAALERKGMRSDALILFASDNGGTYNFGGNNRPLRGHKGQLYEGGVRVPAVAVWQGKLKAGAVVEEPMHIADLYPTLLNVAGVSPRQKFPVDGVDVWDVLAKGERRAKDEIVHNVRPDRGALRKGDWKIIVNGEREFWATDRPKEVTVELFNIAKDPNELVDLADKHPEKVRELRARLYDLANEAVPPMGGDPMPAGWKPPKPWHVSD